MKKMSRHIYWAGDSTVKHNRINTYPQTGIGQVFNLYLKPEITVCNHAENGRSTKSFLDEKRLEGILETLAEDDFLFIQFGHNDEKEDVKRHTDPFGSFQENLKIYIQEAKNKGAHPVLITPVYRRLFEEDGNLKELVHMDYPKAMLALAEEVGVPVIDLCESSRQLLQTTGDEVSKKWFMNFGSSQYNNYPEVSSFIIHLRYEGFVTMAGLVADGLKKLGGIYEELLLS